MAVPAALWLLLLTTASAVSAFWQRSGGLCIRTLAGRGRAAVAAEGSSCWTGWSAGTCRRLSRCGPALRAVLAGRPPPRRCGFAGFHEVVCCADAGADAQPHKASAGGGGGGPRKPPLQDRPSLAACMAYEIEKNGLASYILLGKIVHEQEFPHMAALGYEVRDIPGISWLCGGTLISDQFVLTAAHCCASRVTQKLVTVQLATVDLASAADDVRKHRYGISETFIHSNYRKRYFQSDIALLRLDRKVLFTEFVFPACLNTNSDDPSNFVAAGWGATNSAGTKPSSTLRKTTISSFPLSECQSAYKHKFPKGLDSSVICAGDPKGKSETCAGDSGGPLITGKMAPYSVNGITSAGPKPCGSRTPGLYTRVSEYLDWIEKHVWPSK